VQQLIIPKFYIFIIKLCAMQLHATSIAEIIVLSTGGVQCSLRLRAIWVTD